MTSIWFCRTRLIAAAAGLATLPGLAWAATAVDTPRIGAAVGLKGQVTAIIDSQPAHAVKNGEEVYGGEHIKTGPGASVVVEFLDNSTFQIGANADVVINPSQVKPVAGSTVRSVMINAGAFRAIAALTAANSQTILSTSLGAFASGAGVVVGDVRPQRIAIFPVDGPGTFVYSTKSVTIPKGGALIADIGSGRVATIQTVAADPATTAVMSQAMAELGAAPAAATAAAAPPGPVGYVTQPTGAVAGIATGSDGYIDALGGTQSKEEIAPETQVAAAQQPPMPPTPPTLQPPGPPATPPPANPIISPPPLPPPVPASI